MIALISGELLKVRTTRSFWWTVLLGLALVALVTILQANQGLRDESNLRSTLSNTGIIGLLMIVLGVVGSAGEYRHGTITSSLLSIPSKTRFLAAKAIAYLLAGLAVAVVSFALVVVLTLLWNNGDGQSFSSLGVSGGDLLGIFLGATAYVALAGVLGVGVGALLTNQVAAVVGVLILLFIIDPSLAALIDGYGKWGLSGVGMSLSGGTGSDGGYPLLSPGAAAAVFFGYSAAMVAAATVATQRRDVSS